jgi:hypothetical protein
MKYISKINFLLVIFLITTIFYSCTEDAVGDPAIEIFTAQNEDNKAIGIPGELLKIEGSNLSNLKQIILNNKFNVTFNPNLNSDVAIFFNIPSFDVKNPLSFGVQPIKFIYEGREIESQVNVVQPLPTIIKSEQELPSPSEKVTLTGNWFYDVKSVSFNGNAIPYEVKSITSLLFTIPSDYKGKTADIIVTTAGGVSKTFILKVKQAGPQFILITDFDGNGKRNDVSKSYSYSLDGFDKAKTDAQSIDKNYAEMRWSGNKGFNGFSIGDSKDYPGATPYLEGVTAKPEDVFLEFDYNANVENVAISVRFNPNIEAKNYAYDFKSTGPGWKKASINILDFKENYGGGPAGTIDQAKLKTFTDIQFVLDINSTVNPSVLKIDNVTVKYIAK